MKDEIFDITPTIHQKMAFFPGDKKFQRYIALNTKKGDHITLSHIETTLHLGAHADAPCHYHKNGTGIDSVSLVAYLGPCQVIQVSIGKIVSIMPHHIKDEITQKRILFKTNSFDPNFWNDHFCTIHPETIKLLKLKEVLLVGIDTPSVDPANSKTLDAHMEIFRSDIRILEGIDLKNVKSGQYELVALPLKIKDADASPVRAILIKRK